MLRVNPPAITPQYEISGILAVWSGSDKEFFWAFELPPILQRKRENRLYGFAFLSGNRRQTQEGLLSNSDSFEKNYPAKLKSAVSRIMRPRVLVSLIDNPALLTDVLESVADRAPLTVRSLNFHASGGRFPRISTVFEYQPALGEVVRRFGS